MQQNNPSSSTQSQRTIASHHRLSTSSDEFEINLTTMNGTQWEARNEIKPPAPALLGEDIP